MVEKGIIQLPNGYWKYRVSVVREDGKRVDREKTTDEFGNKLKTKKEAIKAKERAIRMIFEEYHAPNRVKSKTFEDVYNEYCDKGRAGKAYSTIAKQDSCWKNHMLTRFGNRKINSVTIGEINDFLEELYHTNCFAYSYVESFLKMFYLIYGQAYNRGYISTDYYNRMCINKGTKIHMPKKKVDEDYGEIVIFDDDILSILDKYFRFTPVYTAFLLGRYCGLRINEAFGLKWSNIDFKKGVIRIDRQMQYQNGIIKLVPPKTANARRIIYMSSKLQDYLYDLQTHKAANDLKNRDLILQNQRMITDIDGERISSTEMVNCADDGKLLTLNSFKYHIRELKHTYAIEFKFHYLRHTFGTKLAELNTPVHLLCNQMGHANVNVTNKYYLSISRRGMDILKSNLDKL